MPRRYSHVFLLLIVHYFSASVAQRNITIEDSDPSIAYNGLHWELFSSSLYSNGSLLLSPSDPNASATFTFTGIAVYFLSPLWQIPMGTQVQLDNGPSVPLNLTNPNPVQSGILELATAQSAVVWSSGPIPNGSHTLTMTRNPSVQAYPIVLVDAIIYTVLDSPPLAPSSSPSTANSSELPTSTAQSVASSTNTSSNHSSPSSNRILPMVFGAILVVLGTLCVGFIVRLCFQRKKRPKSEVWTVGGAQPLLDQYNDTSHGGPSENFNPWAGFLDPVHQQQQQTPDSQQGPHSPVHATMTSSMMTEKSLPGTVNPNQLPLGSASHSPIEFDYYSPPLGRRSVSVDQLSSASDLPPGAAAAGDPHQFPPSPTSLRGPIAGGASNVQPGNSKPQKKTSLVTVNRTDNESEDLVPPAYSL